MITWLQIYIHIAKNMLEYFKEYLLNIIEDMPCSVINGTEYARIFVENMEDMACVIIPLQSHG